MNPLRTLALAAAALLLAAAAPGRAWAQEETEVDEEVMRATAEMLQVFDVDLARVEAYDPQRMTIACALSDDGETMGCTVAYPTDDPALCRGAAVIAHVGAQLGMLENELDANLRVSTSCGASTVEIVEDIAGIRLRQATAAGRVTYEKSVSFEQG